MAATGLGARFETPFGPLGTAEAGRERAGPPSLRDRRPGCAGL